MSLIRLITAFLFAVVLLLVGYAVFWLVAFKYAEQKMVGILQERFSMAVSYDVPQWLPEVGHIAVRLPHVSARVEMPGGEIVVVRWPDVTLRSAFFDEAAQLDIRLSSHARVEIIRDDSVADRYDVVLEGADLSVLDREILLATRSGRIMQGETHLLGWQDGRLKWRPLPDRAHALLVQARNVQGVAGTLDDVSFRATLTGMSQMGRPTWALLRLASQQALRAWLQNGVKLLQAGGEIVLDNLSFTTDDWKVSMNGLLTIDADGVPRGDLVIQGEDGDDTARMVEQSGVILPMTTEERLRYDQAMQKFAEGETQAKLVLHQGVAILNTLRVGRVPSTSTILKGWL